MFTGIVEGLGTVRNITRRGAEAVIEVEAPFDLGSTNIGDSISINGVCLTVVSISGTRFGADVSMETMTRTTLHDMRPGERVNLERALTPNTPLGGHFVLGHVDCVGTIRERSAPAHSLAFGFEIDRDMMRYVVSKGSVAVDGISLTVNRCEKTVFYVTIIPHTAAQTTLGFKKTGSRVNIETDILGKYVEKFMTEGRGIDREFLAKHGFLT
ncbi:MAG: riboflavin synthase [Deltaproteobacteria bacterium]|nr:riboflavin synthase [Deltaproteobacteria bacterium]